MGTGMEAPPSSAGKKWHPRLAIGVGGGDSVAREFNNSDLSGEWIEIELMMNSTRDEKKLFCLMSCLDVCILLEQ